MEPRLKNHNPKALELLMALGALPKGQGVPDETLELVHLRASQINGCSVCLEIGRRTAKELGMKEERLFTVAGWRDAPYFTDAERAALALTEAMTRLGDCSDPVPDPVWEAAAKHFDPKALSALVIWIATVNLYNRINVTTRQVAGSWG